MEAFGIISLYHLVAWVGTGAAFLFLLLMIFGLDDVFDGWFVQRLVVSAACGFGWTGVFLQKAGWTSGMTLIVSILVGLGFSGLLLALMLLFKRSVGSPSEDVSGLVGKTAEVVASTRGDKELKVRMIFRGTLQEFTAMKDSLEPLEVGTAVKVDKVVPPNKLYISPIL
jgi:hypothetical protein